MCATIARSAVRRRRRRSSTTRRDRGGEHPCRHLADYAGILQADAYAGFNDLYHPARKPGPIIEAACWAHGRRKLFVLADVAKAPLAIEAVRRIDAIFDVEREINGLTAEQRLRHTTGPGRATGHVARALDARRTRASSRDTPMSPRPWTTCSSDGRRSPASLTMAGFA